MNNEITPERLYKLAQELGKNPKIYCGITKIECCTKNYEPHKDWNQCGELLEWLCEKNQIFAYKVLGAEGFSFGLRRLNEDKATRGETLKTAIVLSALDYLDERG